MLRTIAICPEPQMRGLWEQAIRNHRDVALLKLLPSYPEADMLLRVMRAHVPEAVFIDMQNPGTCAAVARIIEKEFPGVQCVGIHPWAGPDALRQALRFGLREVLSPPFDPEDVKAVLGEVKRHLDRHPVSYRGAEHMLGFLPAKPGAGASLLCSNFTRAVAAQSGVRTLLLDLDIHSGLCGFLFNAQPRFNMVDAANRAHELDAELWPQIVTKAGPLDLIPSGAPHVGSPIARGQIARILEFARRSYDVVCADFAGSFDETSLEALREVNHLFLVSTPEVASLHHARLKVLALNDISFEGAVSLVINRVSSRAEFTAAEIEKLVGLPVSAQFPCCYSKVRKAVRDAQPVAELAPHCRKLAERILRRDNPGEKRNRFVQYFALTPMRYTFRKAS